MEIGVFVKDISSWEEPLGPFSRRAAEMGHKVLSAPSDLRALDVMITHLPSRAALEAALHLKAIFLPMTGVAHLPSAFLKERGVRLFNVHANAVYVAERALALTLAFLGRVVDYHNSLAGGLWHGPWVGGGPADEWDSLRGKRCAILGTGAIGVALAAMLKAFSCDVTGWRRRMDAPVPAGFDRIATTLEAALSGAEIVFVALPGTAETKDLLSERILMGMRGALLVNVGRGTVVSEEGLWRALSEGILRGAAIDTWYEYPKTGREGAPSRFPIHGLPNVVLSPHVGGSAAQSHLEVAGITLANVLRYLETGDADHEVDLDAMY